MSKNYNILSSQLQISFNEAFILRNCTILYIILLKNYTGEILLYLLMKFLPE